MKWYLKVLKQYVDFNGRARRKEYWMFALFNGIFALLALGIDHLFGITFSDMYYGPFDLIYSLAMFLPGLAVSVRRLHDVGKSGWWYFITLVPVVGIIYLLYLSVKSGDEGENEYGADPKCDSIDPVA